MSNVEYLLNRAKRTIPSEILEKAFPRKSPSDMYSIEDRIYQEVLMDYVYADVNLLTGTEQHISLNGIQPEHTDHSVVYRIPTKNTGGKRILSALSLDLPDNGHDDGGIIGAAMGAMSTTTTNLALTGYNTIEVYDNISFINLYLRCKVGLEPNFEDWKKSSLTYLGDLASLACRATCYTKLSISLGEGQINGGPTNQWLRQHIDEMSDADAQYRELLALKARKVGLYKDPTSKRRITNAIMPTMI